mmetsp:Transcript_23661/g.70956  ORF Transcript_23661/g.70956 Transcript_23661/m.70956 type:complete len:378 (+) Transcript_23661:231-1364(+)
MRRLLALLAGAAAAKTRAAPDAKDRAALDAYFDIAELLWPAGTSAGACVRAQRMKGWTPKPAGSNFKTLGVEGVGHHWLETLPRKACGGGGKRKRCGGQQSFSSCGGCCTAKTTKTAERHGTVTYTRSKSKARRGKAWRCFSNDRAGYPQIDKARHNVVLVRDAVATMESILRRFWIFDLRKGGAIDTLAREETFYHKGLQALESHLKGLDCARTFYLSHDHARRAPEAFAAAFSAFLGEKVSASFFRPPVSMEPPPGIPVNWHLANAKAANAAAPAAYANATDAAFAVEPVNCIDRLEKVLPRLNAYAVWLKKGNVTPDRGCEKSTEILAEACAAGDDTSCAKAWRTRWEACARGLRRKHPVLVPTAPLTACKRRL